MTRASGELSDAAAALDYVQAQSQNARHCWVAGFSFGAWIGMQLLMRRPDITGFVSVAPPGQPVRFQLPRALPGVGPDHQRHGRPVAPPRDTHGLVGKLQEQRGITITHAEIEGADHFFQNDERICSPCWTP